MLILINEQSFSNEKPVFFSLSPTTPFTTEATDSDKHNIGLIVALTMVTVTLVTITVVVAGITLYKCKDVKKYSCLELKIQLLPTFTYQLSINKNWYTFLNFHSILKFYAGRLH